jgi:exodeoxyribonuclease VII large subunit
VPASLWSSYPAFVGDSGVTEPAGGTAPGLAWTVSALLLAISDAVAARFSSVTVRGELSGFTRASSGHCYFSLKDADGAPALVRCAMFRRAAALLDFAPADGQKVQLRGRIAVYEPRGELQMVVESLQREGVGSLYEEFLRLRARLTAQGLFDEGRRRPIVRMPGAIGIVTSLGAAALHDVLTALARRAPQVRVIVYPSLVQGAEAPRSLVAALGVAAARHEVDTLLLVRGGGSLEDLWAFNDERVVRAVAASPIPVVCGVGHETDITLCDLAADLRAPTPTAAAEMAALPASDLLAGLATLARGLSRATRRVLDTQSQRLDLVAHRAGRPAQALAGQQQRLTGLAQRLLTGLRRRGESGTWMLLPLARRLVTAGQVEQARRNAALRAIGARLEAAHPQQVLERGFAWVQGSDGAPVLHAAQLATGDMIEAVFSDGRASARVENVQVRKP